MEPVLNFHIIYQPDGRIKQILAKMDKTGKVVGQLPLTAVKFHHPYREQPSVELTTNATNVTHETFKEDKFAFENRCREDEKKAEPKEVPREDRVPGGKLAMFAHQSALSAAYEAGFAAGRGLKI